MIRPMLLNARCRREEGEVRIATFARMCARHFKLTCMGSFRLLLQSQHRTDPSIEPEMATEESSLNFTQLTLPS